MPTKYAQMDKQTIGPGALAAIAGPASAVLLIPRLDHWQAGGTSYFLNGTADEIWPSRLSFSRADNPSFCGGENAATFGVCPSGGFQALWTHYNQVDVSSFLNLGTKLPYAGSLVGSHYFYETGPEHQVPARITLGNVRQESIGGANTTFLVQPHAASTIFQKQLTVDWFHAASNVSSNAAENIARYHYFSRLASRITTQVPSVGVQCSPAQNVTSNSKKIEFPTLDFLNRERRTITVSSLNSTSADYLRFGWVALSDLDNVSFAGVTTGGYVEMPWSNEQSRLVVGCSIHAAWLNAFTVHTEPAYAFHAEILDWKPREIQVDKSWLDALTPKTPIAGPGYFDWEPSTLQSILIASGVGSPGSTPAERDKELTDTELWNTEEFTGGGNRTTFLESIISSQFVDGLARTGSHKAYNNADSLLDKSPSEWPLWSYEKMPNYNRTLLQGKSALESPPPSQNFTELRVEMTIDGYAFRSHATSDYLSIAVVCFHILIVLGHTFWCLWFRTSSGCWDSILELLTLAQNSQPAPTALKHTGAGIKCRQTYSRKARIRVTSSSPDGAEHVELVYEDAVEQHDTELQPLKSHGGYTPTPSIHESEYNQSEQELKRPNVHSHSRSMLERTLRPLQIRPNFRSLNASTLQADSQGYASGARVSGLVEVDHLYG
ncbi:MAG: hypothetical protein Q9164_004849 [Protoblastenia rupestris]